MEEEEERPTIVLFERDLGKIPCARTSLLNGFAGGAVGGLLTFLFTNKIKLSMHSTVGSYCGVTLVFWFYCRYRYAMQQRDAEKLSAIFQSIHTDDPVDPPSKAMDSTPISV